MDFIKGVQSRGLCTGGGNCDDWAEVRWQHAEPFFAIDRQCEDMQKTVWEGGMLVQVEDEVKCIGGHCQDIGSMIRYACEG